MVTIIHASPLATQRDLLETWCASKIVVMRYKQKTHLLAKKKMENSRVHACTHAHLITHIENVLMCVGILKEG